MFISNNLNRKLMGQASCCGNSPDTENECVVSNPIDNRNHVLDMLMTNPTADQLVLIVKIQKRFRGILARKKCQELKSSPYHANAFL